MNPTSLRPAVRHATFALVLLTTVLELAATDLVLPAIPALPAALGGTAEQAQHVLAAFVAGLAAGLLLFGELGARWPQRPLLFGALALFAASSLASGAAPSMPALIALRALQGVAAAAGVAFAPGILRRLYGEQQALRAIGLQGSIESLVPALAPIAGAWLLAVASWRAGFAVVGGLSLAAACATLLVPAAAFPPPGSAPAGGYVQLLRSRELARHGLAQAFALAALLVIVFAAPAVFVTAWGGELGDFIRLQVVGVACFIAAAQLSPWVCRRLGEERAILSGSLVCAAGCAAILAYALAGGRSPAAVTACWVLVNAGFGVRGPAGFLRAIVAARGDDSRAAAMVVMAILLATAVGTLLVAPWITLGLAPAALVSTGLSIASVALLVVLAPRGQAKGEPLS